MSMSNGQPQPQPVQLEVPPEALPAPVPNVVYAIPTVTPAGPRVQIIIFHQTGSCVVFVSTEAAKNIAKMLTAAASGLVVP